jgi:hypothetical protein
MNEPLDGSPAEAALPVEVESAPTTEAPVSAPDNAGKAELDKVQKRIDELTWRSREWERRYYDAISQASPPEKTPDAPTGPPTLEQHGYDEAKYQAAFIEYAKSVAASEAREAIKAERAKEQEHTRATTFKTREADFISKTADYQEKVYDPTLPITPAMVELIAESPEGPQLAYYLANNRDIAAQIANLPPMLAAREMGRIEARISAPAPKPPPVSKAPPPPPKVDVADSDADPSPDDPESDKLSNEQWLKKRNKQANSRKK